MWCMHDRLGDGLSRDTDVVFIAHAFSGVRETRKSLLLTGSQCRQQSVDSLEESGVEWGAWASRGQRGWQRLAFKAKPSVFPRWMSQLGSWAWWHIFGERLLYY